MTLDELVEDLTRVARRARRSPGLLRGFIHESDLPPLLSRLQRDNPFEMIGAPRGWRSGMMCAASRS